MKKYIIDRVWSVVIILCVIFICIMVDVGCCFHLNNSVYDDKLDTILVMVTMTIFSVAFSFILLSNVHIIKYDNKAEELTARNLLTKKTIRIKKADIAEVVISASYRFTYLVITTTEFEMLNKSEKHGWPSHRSMGFYYNKKNLNFVKSFWDGEIERRV